MDKDQLMSTVKQICSEKNISLDAVQETIESALAAAYRKDFGDKHTQNIQVEFDMSGGTSRVFDVKTVVEDVSEEELLRQQEEAERAAELAASGLAPEEKEEVEEEDDDVYRFNPKTEIQISEAKEIDKKYELGDIIKTELEVPEAYGRMAAQTAKQVIIQKLREAERKVLFDDFSAREGDLVIGVVQRREHRFVLVDLGRVTAIMPYEEQIPGERYNPGERIKVLVKSVSETTKGPEIIASRSSEIFLQKLFEIEIPEVASGAVEIKAVAREAGSRSKIAVFTDDDSIDPIGSCVGQRGSRIQTIINEIGGEKIDIIEWSDNVEEFITQSLSPAKVDRIELDHDEKTAVIYVSTDQLSLAIGRAGQNVRLSVKLTGWKINIKEIDEDGNIKETESKSKAEATPAKKDEKGDVEVDEVKDSEDNSDEKDEASNG